MHICLRFAKPKLIKIVRNVVDVKPQQMYRGQMATHNSNIIKPIVVNMCHSVFRMPTNKTTSNSMYAFNSPNEHI